MRSLGIASSLAIILGLAACAYVLPTKVDDSIHYHERAELTRCQEGYTAACKKVQLLKLGAGM